MDFHGGGPEVKTQRFHWRGHGFDPWLRNLRTHMLHGVAKKKKKSHIHSGSQVLVKPEKEYSNSLLICNLEVYNHKGWHYTAILFYPSFDTMRHWCFATM